MGEGRHARALLAYLLYGERAVYHAEVAFSIGSARAALGHAGARAVDDVDIVLVTDQTTLAYPADARVIRVSPETMTGWMGPARYNHRIKICALARLMEEPCERLALIDSDTYFKADPRRLFERITPEQSVMHTREGPIGKDDAWRPLYADPAYTQALADAGLPAGLTMLNAGVLGLHRAHADAPAEVLRWLDAQMPNLPSFSIEQAAFSRELQRRTRVTVADDLVVHYWGFERPFVHAQLPAALARGDFRTDKLGMPAPALAHKLASRAAASALGWGEDARFGYLAWLEARAAQRHGQPSAPAWFETAVIAFERATKLSGGVARGLPELLGGMRSVRHVPDALRARFHTLWV
jgi:hypothetical protein